MIVGVAVARSSSPTTPLPGVESGSVCSEAVTSATFVYSPVNCASASIASVALPPLGTAPTVHLPLALS